ncbi:T9SS type A sorting domain-containing protein [bacterium]|nr:T9SS type A sorting domain-containing protein [bacterium]
MNKLKIGVLLAAFTLFAVTMTADVANAAGGQNSHVSGTSLTKRSHTGSGSTVGLDDIESNISLLGSVDLPSQPYAVDVQGTYAFVACDVDGLLIYDLSNTASPTLVDQVTDMSGSYDVVVRGDYAYVADYEGLFIVDVSDPTNASLAGSLLSSFPYYGVDASGDYAYVTISQGALWVIDVSNPSSPSMVGNLTLPEANPGAISYQNDYVYICDGASGLVTVDVSTPSSPSAADTLSLAGTPLDVSAFGDHLIVAISGSYIAIDIATPSEPTHLFSTSVSPLGAVSLIENTAVIMGTSASNNYVAIFTQSNWTYSSEDGYYNPDSNEPFVDGELVGTTYICAISQTTLYMLDASAALGGYQTSYTVTLNNIDTSAFPQLTCSVTVEDGSSNPVTGLTASNFSLTEDDASQSLASFTEQGSGSYDIVYTTANSATDGSSHAVEVNVTNGFASGSDTESYNAPLVYDVTIDAIDASAFPVVTSTVSVLIGGSPYAGLTAADFALSEDNSDQTLTSATAVSDSYELVYTTSNAAEDGSNRAVAVSMTNGTGSDESSYTAPEAYGVTVDALDASGFPAISATVTVLGFDETPVSGLTLSDFSLSEDDASQTLASATEQGDNSYILVYTTSGTDEDGTSRTVDVNVDDGSGSGSASGSYTAPETYTVSIDNLDESAFPQITGTISVLHFNGDPVAGLSMSDFSLSEDEASQTLTSVTEEEDNSYTVVYSTSNPAEDGSTRTVEVAVSHDDRSDSGDGSYQAPQVPGLVISDEIILIGEVVDVPVTVANFHNISVLELYIDYDTSKLTFSDLVQDNINGAVFNDNEGTVIFSWFSTTPLDLMDDDTLFTLQFETDGLVNGETTDLTWGEASYMADFDAIVFQEDAFIDGSVHGISTAIISGSLSYFTSEIALQGGTVNLTGDTTLAATSDENGSFLFEDILPGSYMVSAEMSDEGHPGVNTLDAYRIQVSLDEINPFETGYQSYAADVDQSALVNTMDAYKIQRVVVGLDEGFDAGEWAFISSSYGMTTENWADAELLRSFSLMGVDSTDQNFYGVRLGDANNTWPSLFIENDEEEEIIGSMTIAEAVVSPGGTATVELRAEGLMDLGVIEYHIEFDPTVVSLQSYDLAALGGAIASTTDSTINVSWFDIQTPLNCGDRILGSFTFQAVNEVNVQSDLELTSVVLGDANGIELFTEQNDGSIMVSNTMGVNYQGAELVTDWALRPSYPNPFNAYTTLSFDVKDAAEVQIHVYNVLGDLVTTLVQGNLPKGRYTKSVNAQNWSSGTYFVVMKSQAFNKVQKIVLLK